MKNEVTAQTLRMGKYRHYKGNDYEVLGVVRHSEDESELVLYRPLYASSAKQKSGDVTYGDNLWVRPFDMFIEDVEVENKKLPRFKYIG
jgi:hypothetical protein